MDRAFLISQHADGTISDADRASLDAALAGDAELRELLAAEQEFTELLRAASDPLPAVRWDALSERISAAVAEAEEPAMSYRLVPRWVNVRLAMAASLLIASSVGFAIYLSTRNPGTDPGKFAVLTQPHVLVVTGPAAELSTNAVAEITIGPPANSTSKFNLAHYSQDLVTRPARVVIASGINPPAELSSSLPY